MTSRLKSRPIFWTTKDTKCTRENKNAHSKIQEIINPLDCGQSIQSLWTSYQAKCRKYQRVDKTINKLKNEGSLSQAFLLLFIRQYVKMNNITQYCSHKEEKKIQIIRRTTKRIHSSQQSRRWPCTWELMKVWQ